MILLATFFLHWRCKETGEWFYSLLRFLGWDASLPPTAWMALHSLVVRPCHHSQAKPSTQPSACDLVRSVPRSYRVSPIYDITLLFLPSCKNPAGSRTWTNGLALVGCPWCRAQPGGTLASSVGCRGWHGACIPPASLRFACWCRFWLEEAE